MEQQIALGDRRFSVIGDSTVEHQFFMTGALYRAGFSPVPRRREGEPAEDYAQRLLGQLASSVELFNLISGMLMPEGVPSERWTPKIAQDTASYIKPLTGKDDLRKVSNMALSLVMDFFADGNVSSPTSTDSSSQSEQDVLEDPGDTNATANGASSYVH